MNILVKAIDEVKYRIPQEILNIAFIETTQNWRGAPVSIDDIIMNKVIRPRVLVDTNIVGGQHVMIPLDGLPMRKVDQYAIVYEIPPESINYRTIISVLSVNYLPYNSAYTSAGYSYGLGVAGNSSDLLSAASRVADSVSSIPVVSNATVELIGYNTVMIRDPVRLSQMYQLRCIVGNEENLNNISVRSHLHFCKLVELAVKAYIYNTLIIKIDQAYLTGGQELGSVKSYVDNLADSNENYDTYLRDVVQGVMFMNDVTSYNRFIRSMISPGL
jgi:hypothetical protein